MITFGRLDDIIANGRALDVNKALQFALDKQDTKDFIIELNTNEQLFNEGIDSNGVLLEDIGGAYSGFTVILKRAEGLPFDRITLYDTGAFYNTFRVVVGNKHLDIIANTIKDGEDLMDRWGQDILGLTDSSIWELILEILSDVRQNLLDQLLN